MKSSRKRVNDGEIVITFTDKNGRVVVFSPEIYKDAAMKHIAKDEQIEWSEVDRIRVLMNRTSKQLVKMFEIGGDGNQYQ